MWRGLSLLVSGVACPWESEVSHSVIMDVCNHCTCFKGTFTPIRKSEGQTIQMQSCNGQDIVQSMFRKLWPRTTFMKAPSQLIWPREFAALHTCAKHRGVWVDVRLAHGWGPHQHGLEQRRTRADKHPCKQQGPKPLGQSTRHSADSPESHANACTCNHHVMLTSWHAPQRPASEPSQTTCLSV